MKTATKYPYFEVQPILICIDFNPDTPQVYYEQGLNPSGLPDTWGVYHYDIPDETGISVANHLADFDRKEEAEQYTRWLQTQADLRFPLETLAEQCELLMKAETELRAFISVALAHLDLCVDRIQISINGNQDDAYDLQAVEGSRELIENLSKLGFKPSDIGGPTDDQRQRATHHEDD